MSVDPQRAGLRAAAAPAALSCTFTVSVDPQRAGLRAEDELGVRRFLLGVSRSSARWPARSVSSGTTASAVMCQSILSALACALAALATPSIRVSCARFYERDPETDLL